MHAAQSGKKSNYAVHVTQPYTVNYEISVILFTSSIGAGGTGGFFRNVFFFLYRMEFFSVVLKVFCENFEFLLDFIQVELTYFPIFSKMGKLQREI